VTVPVQEGLTKDVPNVKVDEVQVKPPAPEPASTNPNPHTLNPVAQAAAAAHAEGVPAEAGRSNGVPARAVEGLAPRGRSEQAAAPNPTANPTPRTAERVDFVDKILRAAKLTKTRGQTRLRVVLNPPHLGSVRVNLSLQDGVLNGNIQAESMAARDFILNHLQSLKDSLESQGIEVGDFDVNVEQGMDQQAHGSDRDAGPARSKAQAFRLDDVRQADPEANDVGMQIRSARLQVIDLVA
jgi:flagellar hook-length control protein FliK